MRERAADLGGTLTIERVPGGGTSVLARLPLMTAGAS
jgi:signal transduction histidine kinase